MPELKQDERLIRIYTPLGTDKVLVRSFEGREEISRLFQYRLELVSQDGAIKAQDIVGMRVTLAIVQSDRRTERYFDGFVSHWVQLPSEGRLFRYRAEVVPWLWFLTRATDCRIFQNQSVVDVIQAVFGEFGFSDYEAHDIGPGHDPWVYCVQYRETAFNFISRLMEKEGIFYFFQHEKGKHTMVLADKASAHQPCPFQSDIRMEPATSTGAVRAEDTVAHWERHYQFRTGKWSQTDYNHETPSTSLLATEQTIIQLAGNTKYEVYDYPGEYENKGAGEKLTKIRMQEVEAAYDLAQGDGDCRSFASGYKFTLKYHERQDQNATYLLVSVNHKGRQGSLYGQFLRDEAYYGNSFVCMPDKVPFRPARITPHQIVSGCQTAVVVGPGGEEIYTDSEGRVKVQFFWDRLGKKDDNSSCWIRVSQPWAGKNWGAIWIPRIGQEVVVDFLEGDPDRPLIVGRVYNAEQTVPYTLPANSTQSGFKSRSSKGGSGANFNEIRFEDKKGEEMLTVHAEKDQTIEVEHDETHWVGHDRTKTIDHDETTLVKHDRTETVDHDETITIQHDRTETVNHDETITIQHDRTENVNNNESITIAVNRTETVGQKESGTVGQKREWSIGQQDSLTVGQKLEVSVGQEISIQAGMKISIQAGLEIEIMAGASSIKLGPAGIQINGIPLVQIQGGPFVMIN